MEHSNLSTLRLIREKPSRTTFLPFALPHITQAEIDEVVDSLRSGWLTTGPKTKLFEKQFRRVRRYAFRTGSQLSHSGNASCA